MVRCSDIYPEIKTAFFRCEKCKSFEERQLVNAKVKEPVRCAKCKQKDTQQIEHNLCTFTDKQYVKIQEMPENMAPGDTPSSCTVIVYDHNADSLQPGDRVAIIGVYRA